MKYFAPVFALAATPAFAHHETAITAASPIGVVAGLAVVALAALVALRQHRAR